tara:strand:+ start:3789 stop:4037 length:249 start_codon:yes stop_codon:yes gene_type:complete
MLLFTAVSAFSGAYSIHEINTKGMDQVGIIDHKLANNEATLGERVWYVFIVLLRHLKIECLISAFIISLPFTGICYLIRWVF